MNNKSILIAIALCVGLQSNMSFSVETVSYWQQFKDWAAGRSTAIKRGFAAGVAPIVGASAVTVATEGVPHGQYISETMGAALVSGSIGAMLGLIVSQISLMYRTGSLTEAQAIKKMENTIRSVLNNEINYPTIKTKLNALYRKNELFGRILTGDEEKFANQACNNLIIEFQQLSKYTSNFDDGINAEIELLQKTLDKFGTTEDKIEYLLNGAEEAEFARAYVAELLRLKNKQAVEQKLPELTTEEKSTYKEKIGKYIKK